MFQVQITNSQANLLYLFKGVFVIVFEEGVLHYLSEEVVNTLASLVSPDLSHSLSDRACSKSSLTGSHDPALEDGVLSSHHDTKLMGKVT